MYFKFELPPSKDFKQVARYECDTFRRKVGAGVFSG